MGSHGSGFQDWFFPVYVGFFAVIALIAVAIVVSAARRPRDRFLSSWPAPRWRWITIPAGYLLVLAFQVALIGLSLLPDKSAYKAVSAAIRPGAPLMGLATMLLALATLAEGFVYLLRVVFPAQRRLPAPDEGARVDEPDATAEGEAGDDEADASDPEADASESPPA